MPGIEDLLAKLVESGGSALHLVRGRAPRVRRNGILRSLEGASRLTERELEEQLKLVAPADAWRHLKRKNAASFGYALEGIGRFRVHLYRHEEGLGGVFRQTPATSSLEELGIPKAVRGMTRLCGAVVIVAGSSGTGKSTTAAAMLSEIDGRVAAHVVTLEDPIELSFEPTNAGFSQREVGKHTPSVAQGIHEAMGMSPDVIFAHELPDERSVSYALAAAEAGVLVLCCTRADGAWRAVERLIETFPLDRRRAARRRLANVFGGATAQVLVPHAQGRGRCAAVEVLPASRGIRAALSKGEPELLTKAMSRIESAQTLDSALAELLSLGQIRPEDAYDYARDKAHFERLLPR